MRTFSSKVNWIVVAIILFSPSLWAETIPYFSPGIKLGYVFGKGFFLGLKASMGIYYDDDTFVNITIGGKGSIGRKNKFDYHFIELQAGNMMNESALFYGGGLGVMIQKEENRTHVSPKLNLFTGFLLFAEMNFYQDRNRKLITDIGLEGNLPIPLKRLTLGFD